MKRTALAFAALSICAAPAFAASITLKFDSDSGNDQQAVFYDDGTMTSAAGNGTYTYDEATTKMCIESDAYNGCLIFDDPKSEVGHSTTYTGDNGASGTATVIAVEN
ncbi:hypothetical protein KUV46_06060 [Thalassovita mediterranea]|nr:hypothetical protein KUV46_06060 [Thalassovita mediterranea]